MSKEHRANKEGKKQPAMTPKERKAAKKTKKRKLRSLSIAEARRHSVVGEAERTTSRAWSSCSHRCDREQRPVGHDLISTRPMGQRKFLAVRLW